MIAFDNHEYKKALELFPKAIKKDRMNLENYFYYGQTLFQCGEIHQAIVMLNSFITHKRLAQGNQKNTDAVMNIAYAYDTQGKCYEALHKGDEALECYKKAIQISPLCASAWNNMGLLYIKSAKHYLNEEINPKRLALINKLFSGAQSFLRQALTLVANNPAFLHSMAHWYESYTEVLAALIEDEVKAHQKITSHYELAIEFYQNAIAACGQNDISLQKDINENYAECLAQYGHHIYRNGQYPQALQLYLKAVTLEPNHLNAISQMGMCYSNQGNYVEARNRFSDILEKATNIQDLADAHLNIACTWRFEKDWIKAEESLEKARELSPMDPYILKEQKELAEAKLREVHISSSQILFAKTNTVSNEDKIADNQISNTLG